MNHKHALFPVVLLLSVQSAMANSFPYRTTVQVSTAEVRSGPGTEFYPTGKLSKGQVVEVYRHKNDEWCAIRPPAGSFSWVLAGAVTETEEPSLLKVKVDGIRTRVGSRLQDAFNVAYVKLRQDEVLKAQGPAVNLPGTSRRAYRVNPPSGEFRWIRRQFLSTKVSSIGSSESQQQQVSITDAKPLAQASGATGSGVVQASHQASRHGELKLKKLANSRMQTFPIPGPGEQRTAAAELPPRTNSPQTTLPALKRQLDRIDLRLTQAVTQPVSQWNLRPLKSKLDRIVEHSNDASAIKRATQLLVRISDFDRLQQRHDELAGGRDTVSRVSHEEVTNRSWQSIPPAPTAPDPSAEVEPDYSGQGWLIPVFTKRRDLPRFALTDDDGAILYFVSPSSGLNLRRYLRTRVGIFGSVTETTSAEPPQLVAQRVVMLDRHQR